MAETSTARERERPVEERQALPQVTRDSSQPLSDLSKHLSNERIGREVNEAIRHPAVQPVEDALAAAQETRRAIESIEKGDLGGAKSAMERALGRLDAILSSYPDFALVPLSVEARLVDIYADEVSLKRITNEVNSLVDGRLYQGARRLLRDFASEIDITTVNLPLASYPEAIRLAARSLDQGRLEESMAGLLAALQSLALVERAIPLPVLRAQALIDEVSRQADESKIDRETAQRLLDDADQQLKFAETLGYGWRRAEFEDLAKAIADIKDRINQDKDSKGLLDKLKESLGSFREKISTSSTYV